MVTGCERRTKSRRVEMGRQRAESREQSEGAFKEQAMESGLMVRGQGTRAGWPILVWVGNRWRQGCRPLWGRVSRGPSQCWAQGHPHHNPLSPSPISWFTNFYSSFKYLVACFNSLFLKEALFWPPGIGLLPPLVPTRMLYVQHHHSMFPTISSCFHCPSSSLDCELIRVWGSCTCAPLGLAHKLTHKGLRNTCWLSGVVCAAQSFYL